MAHLEIILPLTLLVLAFVLKLSIDRNVEVPNLIQAICELPVDMIFLAISFLIAFTISKPKDPSEGLFFTITFIVVAVVVVILWRKTLKSLDGKKKRWILIFFLNMLISIWSLCTSVDILRDTEKQAQIENVESKSELNGN